MTNFLKAVFILINLLQATIIIAAQNKVVCYYASWSLQKTENGQFDVGKINPHLCTHIIYAYLGIDESGNVKSLDSNLDLQEECGKSDFRSFSNLKRVNPGLKLLAGIGGWTEGSLKYSVVAKDPVKRQIFRTSARNFSINYGFDGITLDWRYPAQRGGKKADKENFVVLLRELREEFDDHNLLLTATLKAPEYFATKSYKIPEVMRYLDFANLITFDYHGGWDNYTGHFAALYPSSSETESYERRENVDASITYWLNQGAPAEKILLGVGLYGRTYKLKKNSVHGMGAASTGEGNHGRHSTEPGILGYNEFCEKLRTESWTLQWENEQKVPYAYNGNQWIGYEDLQSIQHKTNYAKDHNLGGVMVWTLDTDDFLGNCGEKYPLLKMINSQLREVYVPDFQPSEASLSPPVCVQSNLHPEEDYKFVCYVDFRLDESFTVNHIDPHFCTHIIYGSLTPFENSHDSRGNIEKLIELRKESPGVKLMVGFKQSSQEFFELAADPVERQTLRNFVRNFTNTYGFDGIHLTLNFEVQKNYTTTEQDKFVDCLRELKEELDEHQLLLAATLLDSESSAKNHKISKFIKYLDFVNFLVLNYDEQNNNIRHFAPLYSHSSVTEVGRNVENIHDRITHWFNEGVPSEKILLGLIFAGLYYNSDSRTYTMGPYSEVCVKLKTGNFTVQWNDIQKVPFAHNGNEWIAYENQQSIQHKAQYVKNHNLGGIAVYLLDRDDYDGDCGEKYPLLKAVKLHMFSDPDCDVFLEVTPPKPICAQPNLSPEDDCKVFYMCDKGRKFTFRIL